MQTEERLEKLGKGLKIVCYSWCEMGHFLPIANLGEELMARGHDVTFVTNAYNLTGAQNNVKTFGGKCIATEDTCVL